MGSASLDILFDKIDHEAAQFIQERTRVAMRLFLKEMGRGLSVSKARRRSWVWRFSRCVVGSFVGLCGAHFLRVFAISPSSKNQQRWDFVVCTNRSQLERLSEVWRGASFVATSACSVRSASSR